MTQVRVDGAQGIATVAAAVRQFGASRTIVNEMAKEIRSAVPPFREAVRANARAYLPGGLGAWVAKTRVTARIRRSASNAGVTFVGAGTSKRKKRSELKRLDAGMNRHPSWGHAPWSAQSVRPGFFTDAGQHEAADAFREAVVVAVDRAAAKVLG